MMNTISYQDIITRCHGVKKDTYRLYYYHRLLALPLTKFFYYFNVKPNTISLAMIVLSILSFFLMIFGESTLFLLGFLLAILAFLFDKIDGDLARLYGVANIKGAVYDFVYHRFSLFLFYLGIGIHYADQNPYMIGIAATVGFIANYIEEMQLLPHRVFAHKYILKGEHINHVHTQEYLEPLAIKALKVFRTQLFLFYYFALGIMLNYFFENMVFIFMLFALIGSVIYALAQLYSMMNHTFDYEIEMLDKSVKGV